MHSYCRVCSIRDCFDSSLLWHIFVFESFKDLRKVLITLLEKKSRYSVIHINTYKILHHAGCYEKYQVPFSLCNGQGSVCVVTNASDNIFLVSGPCAFHTVSWHTECLSTMCYSVDSPRYFKSIYFLFFLTSLSPLLSSLPHLNNVLLFLNVCYKFWSLFTVSHNKDTINVA